MATLHLEYRSQVMHRDVNVTVALPFDRGGTVPYPTLYLLHGLKGNSNTWAYNSRIIRWASDRGLAVVMPEGCNSFWLDMTGFANCYGDYGEFVGRELVETTRDIFPLSRERTSTFIGGHSMGGYGALRNGLKYADTFGKVLSIAAANHFFEMTAAELFGWADEVGESAIFGGSLLMDPASWSVEAVRETDMNPRWIAEQRAAEGTVLPAFKIMVGTEDSLLETNRRTAQWLQEAGADVDYFEGTGDHSFDFVNEHLPEMLDWLLA